MSKTRVVISVNCVFHLYTTTNLINICFKTKYYDNKLFMFITLIGMSAIAIGHSQSLNILCKKRTYLESMSLRNKLLTYWSKNIKKN